MVGCQCACATCATRIVTCAFWNILRFHAKRIRARETTYIHTYIHTVYVAAWKRRRVTIGARGDACRSTDANRSRSLDCSRPIPLSFVSVLPRNCRFFRENIFVNPAESRSKPYSPVLFILNERTKRGTGSERIYDTFDAANYIFRLDKSANVQLTGKGEKFIIRDSSQKWNTRDITLL